MRIIKSVDSLQKNISRLKRQNKRVGFVPTMGALHEGHLSLLRKCRRENDISVLSIFVNPTQFAPGEDYASYPRGAKKDFKFAKKEKIDIIFYPSAKTIYPTSFLTYIHTDQLSDVLCGKTRPGHFRGVTTVVGKLLNIVQPDVLYLGQKDAQQAVIIKRMITDLNFPVKVKVGKTIREPDGLALSSRNKYLSRRQRQEAPTLYRSLKEAKQSIVRGQRNIGKIKNQLRAKISKTSGKIEYIACVDADTLTPLKTARGKIMIALAVRFGKARLIDNIIFHK